MKLRQARATGYDAKTAAVDAKAQPVDGESSPGRQGRPVVAVLLCCAAVLIPWIIYLAVTMDAGETTVRRWGVAWVGLDIAEVIGLVSLALLVRRQDVRASPVAAATGTLFLVDAWFDTVTAHPGIDYLQSMSLAWLAEGPLGAFLMVLAWQSTKWAVARQAPTD
ncbi:hypothetical protein ACIRPK_33660 [Kitasatospora sp. NPDC101801]|uniref:hypothetical protein n=1 Tax=Kitasatospora sp. NPDC101801 TaxID=3364103 RepID=UPI0037FFC01C